MLKPSSRTLQSYSSRISILPLCKQLPSRPNTQISIFPRNLNHFYGTMKQKPTERLSPSKIMSNLESFNLTLRIINNIKIAIDCTKIALKYSKCYMCRLPLFKYPMREIYKMQIDDQKVQDVYSLFLKQCPIPKATRAFDHFDYENKGIYAALSMLLSSDQMSSEQYENMVKFMASLELVNLGFALHHSIGKSYRLNMATRIALKLMSKQMKDSYLVLGGDFFHIKGSVLASQTGNVRLSELLSEVQVDLCKYVHLTENLKNKILENGYDAVELKEIYHISVLKTSPLVKGLLGMNIIEEKEIDIEMKEAYECLGLLMLYRKDLQNFMFNFKDIVKKYGQYITNRVNVDVEQSLPYYIFFQGAHANCRIDLAYLNTVKMMSEQISYLQSRIKQIMGDKSQQLLRKMDYYLMIYS